MISSAAPASRPLLQQAREALQALVVADHSGVAGHGGGEGTLQTGKERVRITAVEPIGNYAVRLIFDDGHNTGLYSWDLLHELGRDAATNWARYLERCTAAGVRHGG